nr:hypothetical protein [Candidatus Cloacimonadota bacterium]
ILTKKVSVYLDRAIDLEMENFVRQSVIEWLKLDPLKGDVITLFKTLTFSLTESEQVSVVETPEENIEETGIVTSPKPIPTNAWIILIIGVVLIAILIILNTTFRSGIQALSNSIGGINKSSAEQSQTIRAKFSGADRKSGSTILDDSYRKPLKISILENQMEKEKELVDFSFLENLTFPEFSKLIDDESFNDIEKSFILSNLPVEFVQNFLSEYSGDLNNLIKTMLSDVSLQKDKMTLLRTKLIENHSQLLEERALKTNGKDTLVKFINNLSYDESRELFEKVNILDEETGAEIRDQIFLFEDVYKIEDDLIKELIFNIDHELMVIFLASVEENIKDKFINNMSARIASMFREDIKFMGEVPDDEKKNAINKTIDTIRVILNYK